MNEEESETVITAHCNVGYGNAWEPKVRSNLFIVKLSLVKSSPHAAAVCPALSGDRDGPPNILADVWNFEAFIVQSWLELPGAECNSSVKVEDERP
ncbi:hypothetical protein IRJ41_003318 [Triplophysa rosa]|uniref:Uncharacterized protein n=1 Tax=Triplophysa rosa TaxID=992332 RepID=A0A9W7TDP9_TRIRA|nr:hypothetical protein IRJ41_003318 [Triplophysa rosa]